MSYYYIVCKFLDNNKAIKGRAYTYEVNEKQYRLVHIGVWYGIVNSDNYNYRGAIIEITGKFQFNMRMAIQDNYFVTENCSSNNVIKIKTLKELSWCGDRDETVRGLCNPGERGNFIDFYPRIDFPLLKDGILYSCIEDLVYGRNGVSLSNSITFTPDSITISASDLKENSLYFNKKENNTMTKIFGNVEFGKYTGNDIKLSIKGLAYRTNENNYVVYDKEALTLTNVTDFIFDTNNLLYLIPVAIKNIKVGDIIKHNNSYVIVKNIFGSSLGVIVPSSKEVKTILPEKNIFGFDFCTKVVSLIGENSFGDINENNPFGTNMLPFLLMSDNSGNNNFDMKTFFLLNYMNGGKLDFQSNPFLLMMLSDNKDMGDMLPLLFMTNSNIFGAGATKEENN